MSAGWGALACIAGAVVFLALLLRHSYALALLALLGSALCACATAVLLASTVPHRIWLRLSHDIRQPLGAVGLYAAALKGRLRDREEEERILDRIETAAGVATRLISCALNLSRIEAGHVISARTSISLGPVLSDIVDGIAADAEKHGVRVTLAPSSLQVRADPAVLEMILQSAVLNAVHLPRGSRILVGARRIGATRAAVQISDNDTAAPRLEADEAPRLGHAIALRISSLASLPVTIRSTPGRGVTLLVFMPRANPSLQTQTPGPP